jgi:hypothetical protein
MNKYFLFQLNISYSTFQETTEHRLRRRKETIIKLTNILRKYKKNSMLFILFTFFSKKNLQVNVVFYGEFGLGTRKVNISHSQIFIYINSNLENLFQIYLKF